MRVVLLSLVIFLGGCLATQPSHNPLKKKKEAATVAPVASKKPRVEKPEKAEKTPEEKLALLGLSKVELMQAMFLMQKDLNSQILKMAEDLTPDELQELNEFLSPFGRQIKKKPCTNPNHDHSKPKQRSRAF